MTTMTRITAAILASALVGCASDAVNIIISDSTHLDVANMTWQENTKIPVISYRAGPYSNLRVSKSVEGYVHVEGSATITNTLNCLDLVRMSEEKHLDLDVTLVLPLGTNAEVRVTR